jgi:hypothetical protein
MNDRAERAQRLWTIHGWSQGEIAAELGVSQQMVSRYVEGFSHGPPATQIVVPERFKDNPWGWAVTEGRLRVGLLETSQWELGDLACIAVEVGPLGVRMDTEGNVRAYAAALDLEYDALNAYRKLANRYPPGTRVPGASWSAHRAAIGAADPVALLKALSASAGGDVVTVKAVRQAVKLEKLEHAVAVAKRGRDDAVESDGLPDVVGWINMVDAARQELRDLSAALDVENRLWELNTAQREAVRKALRGLSAEVAALVPRLSDEVAASSLAAWRAARDAEHGS